MRAMPAAYTTIWAVFIGRSIVITLRVQATRRVWFRRDFRIHRVGVMGAKVRRPILINIINMSVVWAALLGVSLAYAALPTDSTNSNLTTGVHNPATVFVLDKGYVNNISGGEQQSFTTNKICPTGFNIYVDLRASKIAQSGTDLLQGFGTGCVNSVTANATNYTVGYLVSRRFMNASPQTNVGYYIGLSASAWGWGSTVVMFTSAVVGNPSADFTTMAGFYWTAYCYSTSAFVAPPNSLPYCVGGESASSNPY